MQNLIYDVVLGIDTLKKIHATIDFTNKTLTCIIQNKLHNISLGHKPVSYTHLDVYKRQL